MGKIIDEINEGNVNKINEIIKIRTQLQNVEDCCRWKTNLIEKCDEVINKN